MRIISSFFPTKSLIESIDSEEHALHKIKRIENNFFPIVSKLMSFYISKSRIQ